jgi:hypothetical protein
LEGHSYCFANNNKRAAGKICWGEKKGVKGVLSDVLTTPMNKSALLLRLWRLAASAILTNSGVVPALEVD